MYILKTQIVGHFLWLLATFLILLLLGLHNFLQKLLSKPYIII